MKQVYEVGGKVQGTVSGQPNASLPSGEEPHIEELAIVLVGPVKTQCGEACSVSVTLGSPTLGPTASLTNGEASTDRPSRGRTYLSRTCGS